MTTEQKPFEAATHKLLDAAGFSPDLIIELGSGLGPVADYLSEPGGVFYKDIPGMSAPTIAGHAGIVRFVKGPRPAFLFCGRRHLYEGITIDEVSAPIYIASNAGAKGAILCSACGALDPRFEVGKIALAEDIFTYPPWWFGDRTGKRNQNYDHLHQYTRQMISPALMAMIQAASVKTGEALKLGVMCWLSGPTYESVAEVEALRRMGAQIVTMSGAPQLDTAFRVGVPAAIVSGITNYATGIMPNRCLDHNEVIQIGAAISKRLGALLIQLLSSTED